MIRSPGSLRRRRGSGALEEKIGVWGSQEEKDKLFFSIFLSLNHIKHFFSFSPELNNKTTQFKLCTKDYCGSAAKESVCNVGDLGLIPGLGRYPGEGKVYPLQNSGLENSMDYIVHGVTKSWTGRFSLSLSRII